MKLGEIRTEISLSAFCLLKLESRVGVVCCVCANFIYLKCYYYSFFIILIALNTVMIVWSARGTKNSMDAGSAERYFYCNSKVDLVKTRKNVNLGYTVAIYPSQVHLITTIIYTYKTKPGNVTGQCFLPMKFDI